MSRNASGTYSLPASNPVVTGTVISSTWANNTLTDIATALTDSLDRTGKGAMSAALKGTLGAVGAPGFTFDGDTNTGMWAPAADTLAFSVGGVEGLRFTTSGGLITATFPENSIVMGGTFVSKVGTALLPDGSHVSLKYQSGGGGYALLQVATTAAGVVTGYDEFQASAYTHHFYSVTSGTTLVSAFGGDAYRGWVGFHTAAVAPTATEIPASMARVWHNSASGETRLYANVAGVLKSVLLS